MIQVHWKSKGFREGEYYLVERLSTPKIGFFRYANVKDKDRLSLILGAVDILFRGEIDIHSRYISDFKYLPDFYGHTAQAWEAELVILNEVFSTLSIHCCVRTELQEEMKILMVEMETI